MAIKKIQIIPPDGGYVDILHPETSADVVKFTDGSTVESHKAEKATQNGYGHIRLQDIPNPVIATRLEAEAGTNNTKMMTPLSVKEAVDSNPLWENTKGSISSENNTGEVSNKHNKQVNASNYSTASAERSQVNASNSSTASGNTSQVNASQGSTASELFSQVNASVSSTASENSSQVNASRRVINNTRNTSAWGSADDGNPSPQNIKVEIGSISGTVKASGAITGNSSFADFAEYFESLDGKSIPLGTIVSLAPDGKIKIATEGDNMVGVISQTAGIILNAQGFEWKDRYLYDRYGQPVIVDKEIINEETREVEMIKTPMLNVNWDEDEEYISREDREEWNVVGLTGQIFVNVDDTVQDGDFIQAGNNGIATKGRNEYGQNWQVMKITTPYEENLGFGIAMVFVR